MISARLPGGESAGLTNRQADPDSSPLRDVQLISRAQLAPFFAAANFVAALMMSANLWGAVSSSLLLPWVVAVGGVNLVAMQIARNQSITCVGRSGRKVPMWQLSGDIAIRAGVWLSVPLYTYMKLPPETQAIALSLIAGLSVGALGLVVIPACATAWMVSFTLGVGGAMLLSRHTVPGQHLLSIVFIMGVSNFGVRDLDHLAAHCCESD